MTNYREILRLHSLGLNNTEIASSCRCARNTVAATLQRAANCSLQWPLPEEMSDKQLSERLFPSSTSKPVYKMPDYEWVHREMQKNGVTLSLLWVEYCEQCHQNGELPYKSTQFNKYYADYVHKTKATVHFSRCSRSLKISSAISSYPEKRDDKHLIKTIHFTFPVTYDGESGALFVRTNEQQVESVVLLSK